MNNNQPRWVKIRAKSSQPIASASARRPKTVGQGLVEFALIAPLLLLVIFGIIDIARIIQAQVTVNNAARQAIRFAVTGQTLKDDLGNYIRRVDSIEAIAIKGLAGLPLLNTNDKNEWGFYQVDCSPVDDQGNVGLPNDVIEVRVRYTVKPLTPLLNAIIPSLLLQASERSINEEWGAVQSFDRHNLGPLPPALPTWTPVPFRTQTFEARQTQTAVAATMTAGPPATLTAVAAFQQTVIAGMTNTAIALIQTAIAIPTQTAAAVATQTARAGATQTARAGATQTAVAQTTQTAQAAATQTSISATQTASAPTSTKTNTPTITPTSTKTFTPTNTPTNTQTPTITQTATKTNTPTKTSTPTNTATKTNTATATATRVTLYVVQVLGYKMTGSGQPLDVQIRVNDSTGVYRNDATVTVSASNGVESWSGTLTSTGSNGYYRVCDAGLFSNNASLITINATASKTGYTSGTGSGTAQSGNMSGCP